MPRILVLDDEPLISMLMEGWLRELGCEVVGPARCVADGLSLAKSSKLDGAILDVNLAGEKCFSLAAALTQKGVPVAFATGVVSAPRAPYVPGRLASRSRPAKPRARKASAITTTP